MGSSWLSLHTDCNERTAQRQMPCQAPAWLMSERWSGRRFEISRSIDQSFTLLLLNVLKIITQLPYIIIEPI